MEEPVLYDISKMASSVDDVPAAWIYKNYYAILGMDKARNDPTFVPEINQPFDGRTIKVRSIANRDSNPSLCFYFKNGKYLWYDYSDMKGGDAPFFVAYNLSTLPKSQVDQIIMNDYETWLKEGGNDEEFENEIIHTKPKFHEVIDTISGTELDFWRSSKINYETLVDYQVKRLKSYTIVKDGKSTTFHGFYFGYYSNEYGLYQIYNPHTSKGRYGFKYLNVNTDYLIGSDQLTFKPSICAIVSGLKDLMAIKTLDLKMDFVANRSESYLLPADKIEWLKTRYPIVISMLDNDRTGINAMRLYEKVYRIPSVRIDLEKDLAKNNEMRNRDELIRTYAHAINKITSKWVSN